MGRAVPADGDRSGKRFNLVLGRIDDPAAAHAESTGHGKHERGTKPGTHLAILHEGPRGATMVRERMSVPRSAAGNQERLLAGANALIGRQRIEQPKPGDHQAVGLAGQRRRQYRVTLRIARQFLGKANQVLPLERRTSALDFHIGATMIAHFGRVWQPQPHRHQ